MRMRFLPDKPITNDQKDALGFLDFVKLIQTSIYHTESPFVYGVLGDWGSGKTSILRLLQNRLTEDFQNGTHFFVPIWFNAWQYENETNIVYPLLHAIKDDYKGRFADLDMDKEFGQVFLKVVATSALALTDLGLRVATKHLIGEALELKDITDQLKTIEERPDELELVLSRWVDEVARLHGVFKTLLDTYATDLAASRDEIDKTEDVDVRFVILIDDLDRCLPETTIAVLESIKNYLAVENCIFVLGLNPQVIYQGIRIKYRGLEINGREYLEKILNYSFYVPEPDLSLVAKFGTERLEMLILDEEKREQYHGYFEEFGEVLQKCHFNNPRKIKRILNRYLFFISKYEDTLTQYYSPNIVRLIILAEYFPSFFQLFLGDDETSVAVMAAFQTPSFDIKQFEAKYGVSIATIYPQLSRMGGLLGLVTYRENTLTLTEQAQAISSITRMI